MIRKIYFKLSKKIIINSLQKGYNKGILRRWQIAMLLSLFENNNLICKICNQPITNINEANCDHIIPLSRNGARWEVTNFQLAHKKCNFLKGNKII